MNDLLICAEAAGREVYETSINGFDGLFTIDERGAEIDYNPLTNDAQAYRLLKYLLHEWYFKKKVGEFGYRVGELLNTAGNLDNKRIVAAVVAMEDTHE